MASLVLTDAKIYVDGHDFSGQSNAVSLEYAADLLDATTFGQTTRINTGGLKAVTCGVSGLYDAASDATISHDPVTFARIGTADLPIVIAPYYSAAGDPAYLFRGVHASYAPGGAVGELMGFDVEIEGSGGHPLVKGQMLHAGSLTGNANGTAVQVGAVTASQYVYAALQVFSGTGSFVVKIQSDDNSGFSSPTDRITFTTVATGTAVTSEWTRLAGAITDTYWRISITNPNTRNFAVAIGIQ